MSGIRPLQPTDMTQVVPLLSRAFGYSAVSRSLDLAASLTRVFGDHPWFDPDVPSLVYEAPGGRILGFIGSATRRMTLDGAPVRLACSSSLVADPDARKAGVGAILLKSMLDGSQEVTITDSAREATEAMWTRLGGFAVPIGCLAWVRPLRPVGLAWALFKHRLGREMVPRRDRVRHGWQLPLASGLRVDGRGLISQPLDVQDLLAVLPQAVAGARLVPNYDVPFLRWIFDELDAVRSRGRTIKRLVRDAHGDSIGWYVYMHHPAGICQVVQLMAARVHLASVLGQLLHDAQAAGAVAVYGRADARVIEADALDNRTLLLPYTRMLVHTKDDDLSLAMRSGDAVLTGLEGDTWLHR
jgi:GNAT superfamily N-acetyltransferase